MQSASVESNGHDPRDQVPMPLLDARHCPVLKASTGIDSGAGGSAAGVQQADQGAYLRGHAVLELIEA